METEGSGPELAVAVVEMDFGGERDCGVVAGRVPAASGDSHFDPSALRTTATVVVPTRHPRSRFDCTSGHFGVGSLTCTVVDTAASRSVADWRAGFGRFAGLYSTAGTSAVAGIAGSGACIAHTAAWPDQAAHTGLDSWDSHSAAGHWNTGDACRWAVDSSCWWMERRRSHLCNIFGTETTMRDTITPRSCDHDPD